MGYPKALLPLGDRTFISRILFVLDELDLNVPTIVLGKHAEQISKAISSPEVRIIINPNPENGPISSIRLAISTLAPACSGCLIWPVDQPMVSRILVRKLVRVFRRSHSPMVMPRCGERRGHPVIISGQLFPELLASPLEEGLKTLVRKYAQQITMVPTDEIASIEDIDSPEDYFRLTGIPLEQARLFHA
jgi:molybdenum cofactor cytidylyltransferase